MINVLVVEDEPPILKSICRNIEKANENFKIVNTAYDGKAALEILENHHNIIDLVITDIHIPLMNGIELLKIINKKYPDIITMVLSGFENFNYAKDAFKCGIFDYMLKPVDKILLKKQLDSIEKLIKKNRKTDINKMLYDGINSGKVAGLETLLEGQPLKILLICAGPFPIREYDYLLPGRSYWERVDLKRVCKRFLNNMKYWIIPGKNSVEKIIIIAGNSQSIKNYEQNIHSYLNSIDPMPITTCSSPVIVDYSSLSKVHYQQRIALHNNIKFSKPSFIEYNPYLSERITKVDIKQLNQQLKQEIISHRGNNISELIINKINEVISEDLYQVDLEAFLHFIVYFLNNYKSNNNLYTNPEKMIKKLITNSFTKKDILEGVTDFLNEFLTHKNSITLQKEDMVKEIADFLMLNYDKTISNQTLSDQFGLVPSYISNIFKTSMGLSPLDFILKYRMEKAKSLLINRSDLLTKDVAELVGYSDPLYFSRVFKKYFGENPAKIKKSRPI
ncbi:MAG: response regulator [Spirochaetaceae bacterium]